MKGTVLGLQTHTSDRVAQWQRVGFQSRRLRVRFPLGSFLFFTDLVWAASVCSWWC
jgi:hypothetical protein